MRRSTITLIGAIILAGCGQRSGTVVGTVTLAGRPLPAGSIMLLAADGQRFDTALSAKGDFRFEGVPCGRATIAIRSHPRVPAILLGKERFTAAGRDAARHVSIPERYGSPVDSGLSIEVLGGEQAARFDLSPE